MVPDWFPSLGTCFLIVLAVLYWGYLPLAYTVQTFYIFWKEWGNKKGEGLHVTSDLTFRAWPFMCDFNGHVNNAMYNYILDFSRIKWCVRSCGVSWWRHPFRFANGGVSIRFRREIKPFAKFRVITRLCSYEEHKWWYLRSDFLDMKGRIHAVAVTQCTWKHKSGRTIPPAEAFETLGFVAPPELLGDGMLAAITAMESASMPQAEVEYLEEKAAKRRQKQAEAAAATAKAE